jgi:hypothetical protein
MKNIKTLRYDNWQHLKTDLMPDLFGNKIFIRDNYLFRGHSSTEWKLTPTYDRVYPGNPSGFIQLVKIFKENCYRGGISKDILDDENKLYALAQHHGLLTRLLDWTANPYIAVFFAYTGVIRKFDSTESEICIWILNRKSRIWDENNGVKVIEADDTGNQRLRNQSGFFTISKTTFSSLEEHIEQFNLSDVDCIPMYQVTMPSSCAQEVLSELDAIGINYSSIFPDLEGYAKEALQRFNREMTKKN